MIMTTATATSIRTGMTDAAALPLMVWLSPAFPVGGFAYSHGLEWAVEAGDVRDAATARDWIIDLVEKASGRNDAILLAHAWRAVRDDAADTLAEIAELAVALQPSAERHLEATAQGNAFVAAARSAWAVPALDLLSRAWDGDVAYPVAVGVLAAGHGVPLDATLRAYLTGFSGNLVSAAVRLGPIGQTDGQRIMAALMPVVAAVAREAEAATLDELGGASFRSDIASLRHETQYTRLFRS
jgi:urease accessory protein